MLEPFALYINIMQNFIKIWSLVEDFEVNKETTRRSLLCQELYSWFLVAK